MSKEAVINLFKASAGDRELRSLLETADSPATVVKLAKDNGYEFNETEYAAVVKEMMSEDEELEDSELEVVAGGSDEEGITERQKKLIERYGYDGG